MIADGDVCVAVQLLVSVEGNGVSSVFGLRCRSVGAAKARLIGSGSLRCGISMFWGDIVGSKGAVPCWTRASQSTAPDDPSGRVYCSRFRFRIGPSHSPTATETASHATSANSAPTIAELYAVTACAQPPGVYRSEKTTEERAPTADTWSEDHRDADLDHRGIGLCPILQAARSF